MNKPATKETNWNFDFINSKNELYLAHTNDKYGEWGGDTFIIRLYRNTQTKELQMDYTEYQGEAAPPKPPETNSEIQNDWYIGQPIRFEKKKIIATSKYLKQISNSILELASIRLEHKDIPAMSGIYNRVLLSDSSLIIQNYPSKNWDSFHILKNTINNE
jgi:hypothetical protein